MQLGGKRVERPSLARSRRDHIGMAGKAQMRPAGAPAGVEVGDLAAGGAEFEAMAIKPSASRWAATTSMAPASSGVTLGRRISSAAMATGSKGAFFIRAAAR